jgi:hypothetical protein
MFESATEVHSAGMRNEPVVIPPSRGVFDVAAGPRACFCCRRLMLASASVHGFCRECSERSRDLRDDHLGGEA